MADTLRRKYERRYKAYGDTYAHACLLAHLLRTAEIKWRHIALGAFLGHEAAKMVYTHQVVPNGIIWNNRVIPNIEMRDWIDGLNIWGFLIVYRAAIALVKLMLETDIQFPDLRQVMETGLKVFTDFINDPGPKQIENIKRYHREVLRTAHVTWRYSMNKEWLYKQSLSRFAEQMSQAKGCISQVRSLSSLFDDDKVKEAVRKEIYPFLFGDYA